MPAIVVFDSIGTRRAGNIASFHKVFLTCKIEVHSPVKARYAERRLATSPVQQARAIFGHDYASAVKMIRQTSALPTAECFAGTFSKTNIAMTGCLGHDSAK